MVRFGLAATEPMSCHHLPLVGFLHACIHEKKHLTLMDPVMVIVPFELMVANSFDGFTAMGWIGSVRVTPWGTVLIIRSSRLWQVW